MDEQNSSEKHKILIIEDDLGHQNLLKKFVERAGCSCDCADDGRKGLEKAYSNTYDLMFVDIHTPDMDGFIVINSLRERGIEIPMIAVTALSLEGIEEITLTAGYDVFLKKPIKEEDVRRIIGKYLPADSTC